MVDTEVTKSVDTTYNFAIVKDRSKIEEKQLCLARFNRVFPGAGEGRFDKWWNLRQIYTNFSDHLESFGLDEHTTDLVRQDLNQARRCLFEFDRKYNLTVIGVTGAGKSTLLNALLGRWLLVSEEGDAITGTVVAVHPLSAGDTVERAEITYTTTAKLEDLVTNVLETVACCQTDTRSIDIVSTRNWLYRLLQALQKREAEVIGCPYCGKGSVNITTGVCAQCQKRVVPDRSKATNFETDLTDVLDVFESASRHADLIDKTDAIILKSIVDYEGVENLSKETSAANFRKTGGPYPPLRVVPLVERVDYYIAQSNDSQDFFANVILTDVPGTRARKRRHEDRMRESMDPNRVDAVLVVFDYERVGDHLQDIVRLIDNAVIKGIENPLDRLIAAENIVLVSNIKKDTSGEYNAPQKAMEAFSNVIKGIHPDFETRYPNNLCEVNALKAFLARIVRNNSQNFEKWKSLSEQIKVASKADGTSAPPQSRLRPTSDSDLLDGSNGVGVKTKQEIEREMRELGFGVASFQQYIDYIRAIGLEESVAAAEQLEKASKLPVLCDRLGYVLSAKREERDYVLAQALLRTAVQKVIAVLDREAIKLIGVEIETQQASILDELRRIHQNEGAKLRDQLKDDTEQIYKLFIKAHEEFDWKLVIPVIGEELQAVVKDLTSELVRIVNSPEFRKSIQDPDRDNVKGIDWSRSVKDILNRLEDELLNYLDRRAKSIGDRVNGLFAERRKQLGVEECLGRAMYGQDYAQESLQKYEQSIREFERFFQSHCRNTLLTLAMRTETVKELCFNEAITKLLSQVAIVSANDFKPETRSFAEDTRIEREEVEAGLTVMISEFIKAHSPIEHLHGGLFRFYQYKLKGLVKKVGIIANDMREEHDANLSVGNESLKAGLRLARQGVDGKIRDMIHLYEILDEVRPTL